MSFRDLMETKADRPKVKESVWVQHQRWLTVCRTYPRKQEQERSEWVGR